MPAASLPGTRGQNGRAPVAIRSRSKGSHHPFLLCRLLTRTRPFFGSISSTSCRTRASMPYSVLNSSGVTAMSLLRSSTTLPT